ncbi:MAG: TRAP transporter substrate-binding protein [Burkholderiales bacterium]|nr:TRAP transporter substrate-binding protein [Burkholderiales bacterium]
MHHTRRRFLKAGAAGAATGFPAIVRSQSKITLKISHYVPALHGLQREFMEPWAKEIEAKTNGAVSFQIFAANSSLGQAQNQLDQVLNGVTDIAFGLCGIPRGRMTRSTLIEMPFLVKSAEAGSRALWNLYPKYLRDDYKGLKPLLLMTHNGGLLHTKDRRIEKPEDLRGQRIRTPSPTVSMMLEFLGATPVGMPPGQAYENIQKGVLDGAAFPWDPVRAFKLDEVTKFHFDAQLYTAAFWFAISEKKFNALPKDVQKVIDAASGEALLAKVQGWWDAWDKAGKAAAQARNSTIVTLDRANREQWERTLVPMYNKAMVDFEGQGIKNAREIYIEMQRQVAKYQKA